MATDGDKKPSLVGVVKINDNDIICGRGGLALKHPGNTAYRKIVGLNKELYATCLKTEKLRISKSIVAAIREINGRFLERDDGKTSHSLDEKDDNGNPVTWRDIGDKKAVEKTSQALREGQPRLLKKLAQQQFDGSVHQVAAMNPMAMNGHFNHAVFLPQPHNMMPQFGHMQLTQQSMPNAFDQMVVQGGVPLYGHQPLIQETFQSQQRPNLIHQQQQSFTLGSLMQGHANGFSGNNLNSVSVPQGHESWHDSWGSSDPAPLGRMDERKLSTTSQDSWGREDPTPLPYAEGGEQNYTGSHVFSRDDQQQLMTCLDVDGGDSSQETTSRKHVDSKRPSVKFQLPPQRPPTSAMSLASHLSETSIFSCDALSLDSAIDAAQREAEFVMLGEFDHMSIGTFESTVNGTVESTAIGTFESTASPEGSTSGSGPKTRRSILRKSNKWMAQTAPNHTAGPGIIFTSTLDTTPGGVNSGTDVSDMLGQHKKSAVAFEVDVKRRRSSRMSMCSALTEFSGIFKRDAGSTLSIQSADFRDFLADIDSDDDSVQGNSP